MSSAPRPRIMPATAQYRALREVALDILRKGPGERIATSVQLQEQLNVGSGTIQKALRHLVDVGAVKLRMKGHQGTWIVEFNPSILWAAADLGPVRLAMTPPGAAEITAVAAQLRADLWSHNIPIEFDSIRGAENRVDAVRSGAALACLISRGAALDLGVIDSPEFETLDLGPRTYYRPETMAIARRPDLEAADVRRIAVDVTSFDHMAFTSGAFGAIDGLEYVECSFPEVPAMVLSKRADAGVWHRVTSIITPEMAGLIVEPLDWNAGDTEKYEELSRGIIVWRSDRPEMAAAIQLVDVERVRVAQDELITGDVQGPHPR